MEAPAHFADYKSGAAITANLANLLAADGVDTTKYIVLTDAEFTAIAAFARTLPSTAANNVWD